MQILTFLEQSICAPVEKIKDSNVGNYRCFGTTYRSQLEGFKQSNNNKNQYTPRNIPKRAKI
jgi:hypothetical protein